jgi:UDP-N-acetylglucosamine 4-epimerase
MEIIGLRYFNIFGPKQDPHGAYAAVIPKFIDKIMNNESPHIYGDGSYSRDFTYIENAVNANILALLTKNKDCYGEIFNIGNGGRISILEIFNKIKSKLGSNINIKFVENRKGDIPHSNADITKAKKYLGYEPLVTFEQGLEKTIKYFLKLNYNKNTNELIKY